MTQPDALNQTPNSQHNQNADFEISSLDILKFLQDTWKKLVIAAAVGTVVGFSNWYFLGAYQAELVLNSNGGTNIVNWRLMQKTLPKLAEQIIGEEKVPKGYESLYRTLSNSDWWQKNATLAYGMSKADIKDLASTAGLNEAAASIVSITLKVGGPTRDKAIENALGTKNFLLQGGSYLAIKSLFREQESQIIGDDADLAKKINATNVELGYQKARLRNLEDLAKRFPGDQKTFNQMIDPKESGAKYMPIGTQIIAANTDINNSMESLERLKSAQSQMGVLRSWVMQVAPLINASYDGIALTKQLLEQEARLRATLNPSDPKSLIFVNDLRSNLLAIDIRYSKDFEMSTSPTVNKKGMIKSTVGGLAGLLFFMLIVLLGQRAWLHIKSDGANGRL